jgi:DNA adenine methylase
MRYLGGKCRLGKKIAEVINRYANMDKNYIEPFVGGFWVTQHVSNNFKNKYCYDINKYMIELYKALQKGWEPPVNITKEEYLFIRNNKDIDMALTAFAGIGCSFAGKWFGGYAKSAGGRNYCLNSYNSCNKIRHLLNNIIFNSINFKELNPDSAVIYCDPPYKFLFRPNLHMILSVLRNLTQKQTLGIKTIKKNIELKNCLLFS